MGNTSATTQSRLLALDAMRFIAACGVVWIHTVSAESIKSTTGLGRFAVPFFVIASVWLLGQSLRRRPELAWRHYAWARTKLLYGAFLWWDAIYLAARFAKHRIFHQGTPLEMNWSLLWAGSSLQLWFLPFLLLACLVSFPLIKWSLRYQKAQVFMGIVALVAAVAACYLPEPDGSWDVGNGHFIRCVHDALPSVFLGLAAAWAFPSVLPAVQSRLATLIGLFVLFCSSWFVVRYGRNTAIESLAGAGAMLVAWWPGEAPVVRIVARLGAYAFGIYLVHSLWVEFMQAVATRSGFSATAWLDVVIAVVAILLSWWTSHLLRRTPLIVR